MRDISTPHPGPYIKEKVLPKGMKVTEAAKRLEVGRPALSNMLNGKAALSPKMATRIERVFGGTAKDLLDMQAAYEARIAKNKTVTAVTIPYVPPFLQIKANDIEEWANKHDTRSRLAVFLRTLVNSTGHKLKKVEFPGNDDSERPGWDGYIETEDANPWIPDGKSGWEFGVSDKPKTKANIDYDKRVKQTSISERKETTFVFVTPRRWRDKAFWERSRREEKKWKDVRVYDASNIEEWLEQSIPGQAWFANEVKHITDGVRSLEACWKEWMADCQPNLSPELFAPAINDHLPVVMKHLLAPPKKPLYICADSALEVLAFLYSLFFIDDNEISHLGDQVVVFDKPNQLSKIVSKKSNFIAVTANRDVEEKLAQHVKDIHSIVVYPKSKKNIRPDIYLEPLTEKSFETGLKDMGCNEDHITCLAHESGRSLTVLRRRLSSTEAIRTPVWASDPSVSASLIPFLFASSWETTNQADKTIIELFSDSLSYEGLEKKFAQLLQFEDAPIWSAGSYCGLVSKIDVLFAIKQSITEADIRRFLATAELVLSEDDPSLDLPVEKRWAAGIFDKTREISSVLRDGVCESLVLFSVYGKKLFQTHLNIDLELQIGHLIDELLTPLSVRTLEAHSRNLPMYAEATPDKFLSVFESDLENDKPITLGLLQPVNNSFIEPCYRADLILALEKLAWSEKYFTRVVLILGRMAQKRINDNVMPKPEDSLVSFFRWWMPQTAVGIEKRKEIFSMFSQLFPDVAWIICVDQFMINSRVVSYNQKPRWREYGRGHGKPDTSETAQEFQFFALDMAIRWKCHNRQTLGDLVDSLRNLDCVNQGKILLYVEEWGKTASDEDKSWLREKIRINYLTRWAVSKDKNNSEESTFFNRVQEIYHSLTPTDVLLKYEWLFLKQWVENSVENLEEDEIDISESEKRISNLRKEALTEILKDRGMKGAIDLSKKEDGPYTVGYTLASTYENNHDFVSAIRTLLDSSDTLVSGSTQWLLTRTALSSISKDRSAKIVPELINHIKDSKIISVLTLCPFDKVTWSELEKLEEKKQKEYWETVSAFWSNNTEEEIKYAVNRLVKYHRPKAAFEIIRYKIDKLQPTILFKILRSIGNEDIETEENHKLNGVYIKKALARMTQSGEVSVEDLASLEIKFIDFLRSDDGKVPNLEIYIEKHPEIYVQAIALAFMRSDDLDDPQELQEANDARKKVRAHQAYRVLKKLERIPGQNDDREPNTDSTLRWVQQVRDGAKALAREKVCEHLLGELFSTPRPAEDGIWPPKPIRDVLEQILNEEMSVGLEIALRNKRGAFWRKRDAGGKQERELAAIYQQGVELLQYSHPKIAKVLNRMVQNYESEALWQDGETIARNRLM